MRPTLGILTLSLFLLSCGNKSRKEYPPTLVETQSEELYQQPDTAVTEEVKGQQEEVKVPSTPNASSSSYSHGSSGQSDNMRGFDPASEDDMDDNGMSRYMENNDEEGWD